MRKIGFVLALAGAVALSGCSTLQNIGTGVAVATKSVTNPVTLSDLYQIEASVRIAISGLQAYKDSCVAGAVDKNCRANVAAVQKYTISIPMLLTQLRGFVKNNDQVNAWVVYNQLKGLYTNIQTAAVNAGIKIGS